MARTKSSKIIAKNASNKLELLITIVPKHRTDQFIYLIQSFGVNMQIKVLARGAVTSDVIQYLGLAGNDKIVIFSPVTSDKVEKILDALSEAFKTIKNGKGVACVAPMSSIIGKTAYGFLSNNDKFAKKESDINGTEI